MLAKPALVLLAKAPRPGYVKSRLQPPLTPQQAADLYAAFLSDLVAATRRLGAVRYLGCDPTADDPFLRELAARERLTLFNQEGADLGTRMCHGLARALATGHERAVLIGADLPTLPAAHLRAAFRGLEQAEAVLGPSCDGGYYLVGCRGAVPPIFDALPWGTPRVLALTLARLIDRKIPTALLPFWYDVDRPEDLALLRRHLTVLETETGRPKAPATARVLARLAAAGIDLG
jgi:rSAM/selenodomain-associated transferase 1